MAVEQYYPKWLSVFKAAGIEEEIAREVFNEWAAGLDGELSNEYTQTEYSVTVAAEEAISELNSYES
ncbi:hypothetical protein [Thalassotalea marina]|uniref:Uncharacterized protein n=1 Tax=Thalassotalea marina TaxID=1673741 RepID=A0A919ENW4_9GAMM|nr:hypothetical protein [Thalassotalea marina]GHG07790.1 hypothetical protein GCM10017161_41910 [Thalassotalea marina]